MAKENARKPTVTAGPATIAADPTPGEGPKVGIKRSNKQKPDTIRLSLDLSAEDHWVLSNLAMLRRMSAKAMALKLIRQGSERFDDAKSLREVYAQLRLQNGSAA